MRQLSLLLVGSLAALAGADEPKPDKAVHPRSLEQIKKDLAAIYQPLDKNLDAAARERAQALQRIRAYRYLCGVPHETLALDDELNKSAQAAAALCQKLGKLDHNPPNPGLPEAEYLFAKKAAGSSSLAMGYPTLTAAVDGWMNDSDAGNLGQLGHRRWIIFPHMGKTGLGRAEKFTAMYTFDRSAKDVPDFDFVAFPPPGYVPLEYFKPTYAWNVSPNPAKYRKPGEGVKPAVYEVDAANKVKGEALPLNHQSVDTTPFGLPGCVIFRPDKAAVKAGQRYLVEIKGLTAADGKPAAIRYYVEFVDLK